MKGLERSMSLERMGRPEVIVDVVAWLMEVRVGMLVRGWWRLTGR